MNKDNLFNKINLYKLCNWIDTTEINWGNLLLNINAIDILEKNLDKVNWWGLSRNTNAIHILGQNLDKINWYGLSLNINAIHLLEKN
jgi:hypothetical protein